MSYILKGWSICLLGSIVCLALMAYKSNMQNPDYADSREYISSAYNLSNYNVYSQNLRTGEDVVPAIGREPGFPLILSYLFDLKFKGTELIAPECLLSEPGCGLEPYKSAQWLNRILFALAGICMFWAVLKTTNSIMFAIVGGSSIWLNIKMQSSMDQVVSDPLALFLVCGLSLSFIYTYLSNRSFNKYLFSSLTGLILTSLILTKAIFLYFLYTVVIISLIYLFLFPSGRAKLKAVAAPFLIFIVCAAIGPTLWIQRNAEISGQNVLTDSREGIALSARNIFHDMTVVEYFTAFLYWTPSFGDNLARRYLPESAWERFNTRNENGFFLKGHHDYGKNVHKLINETGISPREAHSQHTKDLKKAILFNPIKHSLTTLPLFYRGVVRDIFILFSFPGLLFLLYRCYKRKENLIFLAITPALFNMIFYPLISLNVGRYQITAAPAFAFGLVAFVIMFSEWRKRKKKRT